MGILFYGAMRTKVDVADFLLRHLEIVVATKLRRGEAFMLSWTDKEAMGESRSACWIHEATDLHFKYSGSQSPAIDRDLIDKMIEMANTNGGLMVGELGSLSRTADATQRRP